MHALFKVQEGIIYLEPVDNSLVRINGKRIEETLPLNNLDIICFGEKTLFQ